MLPLLPEEKEWEKYRSFTITNEQMVYEYLRLIKKQDLNGLLKLFAEDAIVHEPFSKEQERGLRGKDEIENFMRITIMASKGIEGSIEFIGDYNYNDGSGKLESEKESSKITALVTFEDEGLLKVKFQFRFAILMELMEDQYGLAMTLPSKKIKELEISFVNDF
jgi:ketosteroid isomerase-like protein